MLHFSTELPLHRYYCRYDARSEEAAALAAELAALQSRLQTESDSAEVLEGYKKRFVG